MMRAAPRAFAWPFAAGTSAARHARVLAIVWSTAGFASARRSS
jgi:hypothetical protein